MRCYRMHPTAGGQQSARTIRFCGPDLCAAPACGTIAAMFHAIARLPDGQTVRLDSPTGLAEILANPENVVWIDYEAPTEADLQQLTGLIPLDSDAVEDCLIGEQRPRIDEFDDYIFLVLYGMPALIDGPGEELLPRKLAAFCSQRFLITVHKEALPSITEIRERGGRNPAQLLAGGSDEVLYCIVDRMVDRYIEIIEHYEGQIETLEDRSLANDLDRELLSDVARIRAHLLDVRHLAISQRELIRPLANGEFDYIGNDLGIGFRHIADHLAHVIDLADALREQLTSIREIYHVAIATRTNEVIKTLTLFASILLPLSVIAGIFGMNLSTWPIPEHAGSFWVVIVGMLVIAGALLLYFRRRHWI